MSVCLSPHGWSHNYNNSCHTGRESRANHRRFLKLAWFKQVLRSLAVPSFSYSVFAARIPSRGMQTWSTTVVTPLSYDTDPAVLITFDGAKYIFNVGENTTRAFCQSQQNFRNMRGVFLTQVDSQRAGGLGGKYWFWFSCLSIDANATRVFQACSWPTQMVLSIK